MLKTLTDGAGSPKGEVKKIGFINQLSAGRLAFNPLVPNRYNCTMFYLYGLIVVKS